jgi:hypothetical protein
MNNTFDFNRFKNLLLNDGKMYLRNFGTTLIVLCCMTAILWIFTLLFGGPAPENGRLIIIVASAALAMMLVPSKVYGHANLSREGVGFAMMPTSSLEKFLSMFLYCAIVTPVVTFFGGYLIDALLSLFPFGGFEKPIHLYSLNEIIDMGINNGGSPIHLNSTNEAMVLSIAYILRVSIYVSIIQWAAIFMLGNMLFKKHKAGKTFACYLGISYLISMIMGLVFFNREIMERWMEKFNGMSIEQQIQWFQNGMTWGVVIGIIITALLLFFTYRKIKTQKY